MVSALQDDDKQGRNQAASNVIKEYKEVIFDLRIFIAS